MPLAFKMNLQTRIFKHHCEASKQLISKKLVAQEEDPSVVSEGAGAVEVELNHPVVCEPLDDCQKGKASHDLSPPTPPQPATTKSTFIRDDANDDGKRLSFLTESAPELETSPSTSTSAQQLYILHSPRDQRSNIFALQHKCFRALMTANERENKLVPDTYSKPLYFGNEAAAHEATELLLGPEQYRRDTVTNPRFTNDKLEKIDGISVLVPGTVDVPSPLVESRGGCFQYIREATSLHSKTPPEVAGVSGRHIVIGLEAPPLRAPDAIQDDVCLDLNIGPGRVKTKKTLSAIHNERRINGFSTRWRRSEPENVTEARSNSEMPYWHKNLDVENVLKSEAFGSALQNPNYSMAPLRLVPTAAAVISHTVSRELEKTRREDDRWMRDCDLKCNLGLFLGAASGTAEATNDRMETSREPPTHALLRLPEKTALITDSQTLSNTLPHWLGQKFANALEPATADMLQAAFPIQVKSNNLAVDRHNTTVSGTLWCSAEANPEIEESFQLAETESLRGRKSERDVPQYSELARMEADEARSDSLEMNLGLNYLNFQVLNKMPMEIPSVHEKALVEFLRAKKQHMEHFLDKIVVNVDVYQRHPWHYTWGDVRGSLYFCCITKYSRRGNMTRDRMTKEGGRWKQQGMVQPILTAKGYDPASKTYLSYIPCGKNNSKGYYIPTTPGRVKHRHRMIEIALDEDLKSEKRYLKLKVTPKPFLVVCVLRKALNL